MPIPLFPTILFTRKSTTGESIIHITLSGNSQPNVNGQGVSGGHNEDQIHQSHIQNRIIHQAAGIHTRIKQIKIWILFQVHSSHIPKIIMSSK